MDDADRDRQLVDISHYDSNDDDNSRNRIVVATDDVDVDLDRCNR